MGANPCWMPLQKGVKVIAIIDIVLCVVAIILLGIGFKDLIALKNAFLIETPLEVHIMIAAVALILILTIFELLLSIRLLRAADKREMSFCKIWPIIAIIIGVITLVIIIANLAVGGGTRTDMASSLIGLLYRLYMIWVVYAFVQELKLESSTAGVRPGQENGVVYNTQVA